MNIAERYLEHLDRITGRSESVIRRIESSASHLPPVWVFVYQDWPQKGFISAFTLGLSSVDHADWKLGKPELMISVESTDEAWCFALGYIAERLRGQCPFCYGQTINFHAEISDDSKMDAFLIFAPPFLKKSQFSLDLGEFTCNIAGMYPMYSSEFLIYEQLGLEKFWHHPKWDPFNVTREPLL